MTIDARGISDAKINALEGDHDADAAPAQWTPAHVRRLLLEAFKIDGRISRLGGPKRPGSAHPAVYNSREDILIAECGLAQLAEAEGDEGLPTTNPFPPSREEIAMMDRRFAWLTTYVLPVDTAALFSLRAWMLTERNNGSHRQAARRLKLGPQTHLNRSNRALCLICAGLLRDLVPVELSSVQLDAKVSIEKH